MARRPDDTRGTLIFQEGKNIAGDFYIVAVYDDPASATISFSAYELENDCTYTFPFSYSEFDALFKYDSELMNPSNQDGRFHWVIERLDFVQDNRGQKVLCLAQEPTPEDDEDEEDEVQAAAAKKEAAASGPAPSGRIDAATRAKLLKELDVQDDQAVHVALVKSEGARKRFLADLHAKRALEQLKASQRLQKADEEREARLAKLDIIKSQQAEKAMKHLANEEARKSTMAQLETLMKQKEAQAIRRLIQEKDEQDRGQGREKDAARQRRKMQERSAQEVQAIENQRAQQLARKRDEQVVKRETLMVKADRAIAEQVHELRDRLRGIQVTRREQKDDLIAARWAAKREARQERERKRSHFEDLEEVRDKVNATRDKFRAREEKSRWQQMRQNEEQQKESTNRKHLVAHREMLLQWKIEASNRAVVARDSEKRRLRREKCIAEREDIRLRKFRETQFLETMNGRSPRQTEDDEGEIPFQASAQLTQMPGSPSKGEGTAFQKTYEQQERTKRRLEREAKKKVEEAKSGKVAQLGGKNPNVSEAAKARKFREEEEKVKQQHDEARLKRELATEKAMREARDRRLNREEKWEHLQGPRRERSAERDQKRVEAVIKHTKALPIGMGLPKVLVY
mmetsp:Transcript_76200/g.199866  ORF Transcript_76200/g.199866 Transcript_76200/m.199866 type:complete len:628 (-) Transcript_76200:57-1940(-)